MLIDFSDENKKNAHKQRTVIITKATITAADLYFSANGSPYVLLTLATEKVGVIKSALFLSTQRKKSFLKRILELANVHLPERVLVDQLREYIKALIGLEVIATYLRNPSGLLTLRYVQKKTKKRWKSVEKTQDEAQQEDSEQHQSEEDEVPKMETDDENDEVVPF